MTVNPESKYVIPLLSHRRDALKLGKDFAKLTNCSVDNIVCLLSLTPQAVLAAQIKTSRVSTKYRAALRLPTLLCNEVGNGEDQYSKKKYRKN